MTLLSPDIFDGIVIVKKLYCHDLDLYPYKIVLTEELKPLDDLKRWLFNNLAQD